MSHNVIEIRRGDDRNTAPKGIFGRVRQWQARRLAKAELRALPNHLLQDIGIRRDQIDACVDGALGISRAAPARVVDMTRPPEATPAARARAA